MKRRIHIGLIGVLIALSTLACSSDSDDDDGGGGAATFDAFVIDLIDDTADDTDPVAINGQSFTFSDDENAFDDLFP